MNTYQNTKPTNIAWLGEVPSHWELRKLKYMFSEKPHTQNMALNAGAISFGEVVYKDDEKILESTKKSYQEVLVGEFLINPLNLNYDLISLRIALSRINVVVSAGYIVIKNKIEMDKEYYKYLLYIYDVMYMKLLGSGVRSTISFNNIANSILPIPPLQEQIAIANFLDYKTTQIQKAIALKSEQITKLKEYRQTLINQTVTQGLNPSVAIKNSGVEWLGEIPSHWEVKKLKYVASVILGKMLCAENKGGFSLKPYLKSKNIQWLNVDLSSVDEMWFSDYEMDLYKLKQGDLIVSEGGEVGKTCIWNNELPECYIQNSAHKISFSKDNLSRYFLYVFFNYGSLGIFNSIVNRVSIAHLTKEKLSNIEFVVPPLSEQIAIADFLDDKTAQIDTAIHQYQTQIDKLKEYQQSLINEVVTGKVKVSDLKNGIGA